MNFVSRTLALIVLLPMVLTARQKSMWQLPAKEGSGTAASKLDGVWVLAFVPPHQTSLKFDSQFPGKKVVFFKSAGTDVQVLDPEKNTTSAGKAHDASKVSFSLPVRNGLSGDFKAVLFDGSVSGDTISGTTKIDNMDVQWKAVKLLSVWECSNHKNPSHIATTEDEMRSLTMKYKCEGWHKLKGQ